jgi:hypothetical protein
MASISIQLGENWIKSTKDEDIAQYIDSLLETLPYVKDSSVSNDELLEKIGNLVEQWNKKSK